MDDTPQRGRKLASIGFGIGAGGVGMHAAIKFFDPNLIEFLPENQRLIYILVTQGMEYLPIALEAIGLLLYMVGSSKSTKSYENGQGQAE